MPTEIASLERKLKSVEKECEKYKKLYEYEKTQKEKLKKRIDDHGLRRRKKNTETGEFEKRGRKRTIISVPSAHKTDTDHLSEVSD